MCGTVVAVLSKELLYDVFCVAVCKDFSVSF